MKQYCQFASDGDDGPIAGPLASARCQVQTHCRKVGSLPCGPSTASIYEDHIIRFDLRPDIPTDKIQHFEFHVAVYCDCLMRRDLGIGL
jgi:hypothetical protein